MWSGTGAPERCDYHIVWTPKHRFRVLTGLVKDLVEHDIRMLSEWKGCEVTELNVQADHIHLVIVDGGPPVRHLERKVGYQTLQELPPTQDETVLGESLVSAELFCQYGGH